jgi:nitrate reductase gamma subunit
LFGARSFTFSEPADKGKKSMSLYYLTYICLGIFVIAAAWRVIRQWMLPRHLRWELYPVKHEPGEKAGYGGSYLEEPDWWAKERRSSLFNELKFMVPEILFLRGLFEENRKLWWISFPFHFALYMVMGTLGLILIGALGMAAGVQISPGNGGIRLFLYYLTILVGFGGLVLGTVGSAGLLYRRFSDPELKKYSSTADYFNLVFILFFFVAALLAWLIEDSSFSGARSYVYGLLTLSGQGGVSFLGWLTVVLASLLAAYIPLTHMSHMFMKYFMYHSIRWEDEPNLKGSRVEAAILKNLGFKPTWAASHIAGDGTKTWVDLATPGPKEEKK